MFSRDPSGSGLPTGRRAAAVALGLLAAVVVPAAAGETEPGPRVEIRLENVRWQTLPQEVLAVYRGADDRLWYEIRQREYADDLGPAKHQVEREFRKEAPQVAHLRPALFEPGGRVWFIDERTIKWLLGYDGKTWIERHIGGDHNLRGWCPNHGVAYSSGYNLLLGGKAHFPESHGLLVFDGQAWAYHLFPDEVSRQWALLPEADGRGFLAVGPGGTPFLRFAGGQWTPLPAPGSMIDEHILAAAPGPGKTLWARTGDTVRALRMPGVGLEEDVSRWIGELKSSDFQARERATQTLIDLGFSIKALVQKALAESRDLEARYRLKQVLEAIEASGGRPGTMGRYQVSGMRHFCADIRGGVQAFAADIREGGKALGPGLVLADAKGSCRAILGQNLLEGLGRRGFLDAGFPTPKGDGLWLQGDDVTPVRLLDLGKGEIVDQLPTARFWYIHTVAADGTVFVGPGREREAGPLYAYRPGAPEKR